MVDSTARFGRRNMLSSTPDSRYTSCVRRPHIRMFGSKLSWKSSLNRARMPVFRDNRKPALTEKLTLFAQLSLEFNGDSHVRPHSYPWSRSFVGACSTAFRNPELPILSNMARPETAPQVQVGQSDNDRARLTRKATIAPVTQVPQLVRDSMTGPPHVSDGTGL